MKTDYSLIKKKIRLKSDADVETVYRKYESQPLIFFKLKIISILELGKRERFIAINFIALTLWFMMKLWRHIISDIIIQNQGIYVNDVE